MAASQTLRAALSKVESSHPGFSYDLVLGLVRKGDVKVNLNESLLRLQGTVTEQDSKCMDSLLRCSMFVRPLASATERILIKAHS